MRSGIKYLIGLIVLAFLSSCVTVPVNEPVKVVLTPVHIYSGLKPKPKNIPDISMADVGDSYLVDNDGNKYWQYWDLRGRERSEFLDVVKKCKKNTSQGKIRYSRLVLGDINMSEIKPSLYKGYVKCISEEGFKYVYADGFFPDKYRLMISRGFFRHKRYVPLRGEFYLSKNKTQYQDVVKHVKACENKILHTKNQGVKEEYFRGFVSASIESYAKSMVSCLQEYSYEIQSLQNKKWNAEEKAKRDAATPKKPRRHHRFLLEYTQ